VFAMRQTELHSVSETRDKKRWLKEPYLLSVAQLCDENRMNDLYATNACPPGVRLNHCDAIFGI
jgi:hypothetical protein